VTAHRPFDGHAGEGRPIGRWRAPDNPQNYLLAMVEPEDQGMKNQSTYPRPPEPQIN
jgi:hypothetical protein